MARRLMRLPPVLIERCAFRSTCGASRVATSGRSSSAYKENVRPWAHASRRILPRGNAPGASGGEAISQGRSAGCGEFLQTRHGRAEEGASLGTGLRPGDPLLAKRDHALIPAREHAHLDRRGAPPVGCMPSKPKIRTRPQHADLTLCAVGPLERIALGQRAAADVPEPDAQAASGSHQLPGVFDRERDRTADPEWMAVVTGFPRCSTRYCPSFAELAALRTGDLDGGNAMGRGHAQMAAGTRTTTSRPCQPMVDHDGGPSRRATTQHVFPSRSMRMSGDMGES